MKKVQIKVETSNLLKHIKTDDKKLARVAERKEAYGAFGFYHHSFGTNL